MGLLRRAGKGLRWVLNDLIFKLKASLEKIEDSILRIKGYERRLHIRYLAAYAIGDGFRVSMYLEEMDEVRRMVSNMLKIRLSIERAIIRLTIISELQEVISDEAYKGASQGVRIFIHSTGIQVANLQVYALPLI